MLEIIGYDSEGNTFSSLEGLKFLWKIQQDDRFLKFLELKDSLVKTTDLRKYSRFIYKKYFLVYKNLTIIRKFYFLNRYHSGKRSIGR